MADAAAEHAAAPESTANGLTSREVDSAPSAPAVVVSDGGDVKSVEKVGDVAESEAKVVVAEEASKESSVPMDVDSTVELAADEKKKPGEADQEQKPTDAVSSGKDVDADAVSRKDADVKPPLPEGAAPDAKPNVEKMQEDEKEEGKERDGEEAKVAEENGAEGGEDEGKDDEAEAADDQLVRESKKGRKRKSSSVSSPISSPFSPTRPTRERKRAERYEVEDRRGKPETAIEIKQGKGTAFSDIPNVSFKIGKRSRNDDLIHMLHMLLFKRRGKQFSIKSNILQFSGFVWENEEKDKLAVKEKLERYTREGLNQLLELFDLHRQGKKDEQIQRIMEFLEAPHKNSEVVLDKGKKRKSGKGLKGKSPKKAKKETRPKKGSNAKDTADEAEEEDEDDDDAEDRSGLEDEPERKKAKKQKDKSEEADEDEKEEKDKEDAEEDEEEEEADEKEEESEAEEAATVKGKKGGKKASTKKATPAKAKKHTPKKPTPKKVTPKKTPAKKTSPKEKKGSEKQDVKAEEDVKSGGKGRGKGGESPSEKTKSSSPRGSSPGDKVLKGQPTEADLKEKITELLNGADLKKVSLKNVREQLEKHFKCDLDSRKKSIKEIVYEVIPEDSEG